MPTGYHHLTHAERCQIHARLHRGWSKREIARDLGRDPGTISRETSRNRGQRGDRHQQANGKATTRRREASSIPRKMTPERWAVVEDRRQEGGSPEQIAGWVRLPGEGMAGKEWIYPQARADRRPEGRGTGACDVGARSRTGAAAVLPDAATFPIESTLRSGLRWWPRRAGSAIGSGNRSLARDTGGALVSAVDRGSKFPFLEWVEGQTAALTRRLGPVRDRVHTGTADNGKEFARHREIAPKLGAGGGGPAPPSASEGPGVPHPGGGLCPWVGSPRTRPAVAPRPRHSGPSGDPPERLRSAFRSGARPCLGRWLRSGSPAVEMAAIRDRKEALAARIFGSPPRSARNPERLATRVVFPTPPFELDPLIIIFLAHQLRLWSTDVYARMSAFRATIFLNQPVVR